MTHGWTVAIAALAYIGCLFAIAYFGDRWELRRISPRARSIIYALTIAIYCTSWTFYGSVGVAANSGYDFLPIYIGPILIMLLGWRVIRRIVRIAKSLNITSIADFLAARYGKSQRLAALVTVIAVIGIVPYIALQLKAVSSSVTVMIGPFSAADTLPFGEVAFVVAVAMALFTVLFGTRHIDATEHQEGLMLAIAAESLVKLVTFLIVGAFITFGVLGGLGGLERIFVERPEINDLFARTPNPQLWLTQTLLATFAIVLLPRQFHVAVVENVDERDIRRAGWMFPLYLLAINIFVVPIAIAGLTALPAGSVNADMFVLAVPMAMDQPLVAMLAFIGGLSAATAMVIVATVALSIMVCNDLVVPMLLRRRIGIAGRADMGRLLLNIRRAAIFVVLLLAYAYYHAISSGFALASIGLLSFAAIAQFAPAFFGGMFWRRATERGAIAGILAGFATWAYTLLIPSFDASGWLPTGFLASGPAGLEWLRPQALFGIQTDPLTHGVVWSLAANLGAYALVSLLTRQTPVERMQAAVFTREAVPLSPGAFRLTRAGTGVSVGELRETASRYLGEERTRRSFQEFDLAEQAIPADDDEADIRLVRYTERLLASAVGTASARLVMALLLERHDLSDRGTLKLLDEATEAIQYNRDLLQSAINHVDQGIGVFDETMRLVCWNRQYRKMLGIPDELGRVGVPLAELLQNMAESGLFGPGDSSTQVAERLDRLLVTKETYTERLAPSGQVLEVSSRPMGGGGVVVTYSDITDKVVAAEALASANETLERRVRERTAELTLLNNELTHAKATAEEANLGKTRFLAAASHDILQPLNAARLYTSTLVERKPRGEVKRLAGNIDASLVAVEEILSALLDISRLDAGAARPELAPVALGELFAQLQVEFAPLAQRKSLELRVVDTAAVVNTDRRLLRRVLQNLLSNAIKYTDSGGVLLGCRRAGPAVRIEVHDTGSGIPESQQQRIFSEFHRLEDGVARARGLGLGLSIVERIVGILDLKLDLTSSTGVGSAFRLVVPCAEGAPVVHAEEQRQRLPARRLDGLHVLVVDNEEQILDGMAALLGRWGWAEPFERLRLAVDDASGGHPVPVGVHQVPHARQQFGGERGTRRCGVVHRVSGAHDEALCIGGGVVDGAGVVVPEPVEDVVTEGQGLLEPAGFQRGCVEADQRVAEACDIVQKGADRLLSDATRRTVDPRVQEAWARVGVGLTELTQEEVGRGPGDPEVVVPAECGARFREGADRQCVPRDDHLFVAERVFASAARLLQPAATACQKDLQVGGVDTLRRGDRRHGVWQVQDVPTFEVAALGHVVDSAEERRVVTQEFVDLVGGPHVEDALFPLRVGVAGRIEAAVRVTEVLGDVVECLFQDGAEVVRSGQTPCVEVRTGEQRVVVQHLLEVGHEPAFVDRVPVETPAEVIPHAARGHPAQRVHHHLQGPPARRSARGAGAGTPASRAEGISVPGRSHPTPRRSVRRARSRRRREE